MLELIGTYFGVCNWHEVSDASDKGLQGSKWSNLGALISASTTVDDRNPALP